MAKTVDEIMNSELFSVSAAENADAATSYLLALEITGAPVVDSDGIPVGMVSLRDLVIRSEKDRVGDIMNTPVVTINATASVEEGARILAETGYHRLIVVDDEGRAVGNVSATDVIRALIGLPARHPEPFPHYDAETGLTWTNDTLLDMDHVEDAPDGPGVLVLIAGGIGVPERMVWAEASHNVRTRLIDILSLPQDDKPDLMRVLRWDNLRFRCAQVSDPEQQRAVLEKLYRRADSLIRFFSGPRKAATLPS